MWAQCVMLIWAVVFGGLAVTSLAEDPHSTLGAFALAFALCGAVGLSVSCALCCLSEKRGDPDPLRRAVILAAPATGQPAGSDKGYESC